MADDGFALEVALIGALILMNGFFAGSEIAVITAKRARLQSLAQSGHRRAQALLRLKKDPDRFLATVQIGVTLVGTLASAVGGVAAVERIEPLFASIPVPWFRQAAEALAVGAVVFTIAFLSLVVGELVPKALAIRHADAIALWVARPIEWLARLGRVAVGVLTASSNVLLRLLGQRGTTHSPFHTLEDIRAMLDEADEQGVVDGDMLKGAVGFQDLEVRHIMTPRGRITGIPRESSLDEALRIARDSGYSRFPVHGKDLDDVDGLLYARDLFIAPERARQKGLSTLVRPALVVPETKRAPGLLDDMRAAQRHMAMVVDEHGAVVGLVTLEDLFEAIVGEIRDEHDEPEPEVRVVGGDVFDVDGSVSVRELNQRYGLFLPESPEYVTVGGLLIHRLGSLPSAGTSVEVEPYRVTVTSMAARRINRVRVELVPAEIEA